jgi:hypothetical protein
LILYVHSSLARGEEPAVLSDDNSSDGDSVGQADQHNLESLVEEDIQNGSDEDEGDTYTSASCKQSLAKVSERELKIMVENCQTDASCGYSSVK